MRPSTCSMLAVVLALLLACATDRVAVEAEDENAGATETGAPPDMPAKPEPVCPAALGELVECECGHVDGCRIDSVDAVPCMLPCPASAPCQTVECEYDATNHSWECEDLLNPEALDCAFTALLSGEEVEVVLHLENTYRNIVNHHWRTLRRLSGDVFLRTFDYYYSNDVLQTSKYWTASVENISATAIAECMAAEDPEAGFDCLFAISSTDAEDCDELPAPICEP